MTNWMPDLADRSGPKYLAIAEEIAAAIGSGALEPGAKLPPMRNLAYDLGVTLGTVTRAYQEAERRGLVGGEVGRGTFVLGMKGTIADRFAAPSERSPNIIDLTHATPVEGRAGEALRRTLAEIVQLPDIDALCNYQTTGGIPRHIQAGRDWVETLGVSASIEQIAIVNGAQHGVMGALLTAARSGDVVMTEQLTYPGIINLARSFGYRMEGVGMDDEGIRPDLLDEACRRTASKVLYLTPSVQNPTTATMSEARRADIIAVARKHGVFIIEDDVWGTLLTERLTPMAAMAPDRVFFVTSLSKCMAGGLRIGYAVAPDALSYRLRTMIRMTAWTTPPLTAEVASRWIEDGTGAELTKWQQGEVLARQQAALRILQGFDLRHHPNVHYAWLKLPAPWQNAAFKAEMEARGIRIATAESFSVLRGVPVNAARVCFGGTATNAEIERAVTAIAETLRLPAAAGEMVV